MWCQFEWHSTQWQHCFQSNFTSRWAASRWINFDVGRHRLRWCSWWLQGVCQFLTITKHRNRQLFDSGYYTTIFWCRRAICVNMAKIYQSPLWCSVNGQFIGRMPSQCPSTLMLIVHWYTNLIREITIGWRKKKTFPIIMKERTADCKLRGFLIIQLI